MRSARILSLLSCLLLLAILPLTVPQAVRAESAPPLSVEISSPDLVDGIPGLEQTIKVRITNLSDRAIPDVMGYITMANWTRHMTVNLEDYNADKPAIIGKLEAGESATADLPIRLVYTGRYHLYVTAASSALSAIVSSPAIPVTITSDSSLNTRAVGLVSLVVPSVMLLAGAGAFAYRKRLFGRR